MQSEQERLGYSGAKTGETFSNGMLPGGDDIAAHQKWPNLTEANCAITSPDSSVYNCAAWVANDPDNWWQPLQVTGTITYWPVGARRDETISAYEEAFGTLGYQACEDGSLESGAEKIALYADAAGVFMHAARQLADGRWTSKLGGLADIEHPTVTDVAGGLYGQPNLFMRRRAAE